MIHYQLATSLEADITGFMGEAEERLIGSQKVFDTTVSELSEKLAILEGELAEKTASLKDAKASNVELTSQLEKVQGELNEAKSENSRLQAENDGLVGQAARMEKEHKSAINAMQVENRELIKQHAAERSRISDEHSVALANQRRSFPWVQSRQKTACCCWIRSRKKPKLSGQNSPVTLRR